MDSLGPSSSNESDVIRSFLSVSLQDFLHTPCTLTDIQLPQISPAVSQQRNYVDCGCYLLGFVQAILNHIAEVNLAGDAKTVQKNANQLFSWLKLPRNSIRTLRSCIVQTIQKLTKTIGKDEFSVESSDSSDVEEIPQAENGSVVSSKQANEANTVIKSARESSSSPNHSKDSNSSLKNAEDLNSSLKNAEDLNSSLKVKNNSSNNSPTTATNAHTSPKRSPATSSLHDEDHKEAPIFHSATEAKAKKKGLSLFDLHPDPALSHSNSMKASTMKVERVKPIPGIDSQFSTKRREH